MVGEVWGYLGVAELVVVMVFMMVVGKMNLVEN